MNIGTICWNEPGFAGGLRRKQKLMPKKIDDGGPAGPTSFDSVRDGMSLRAHFAGQAMQGLLTDGWSNNHAVDVAKQSVALADALIAELKKGQ